MQVLKLGGSVITVKDEPMTADQENVRRLCEEVKAAWPMPLIIVHGEGPSDIPLRVNTESPKASPHRGRSPATPGPIRQW